ncbi:unnamed protein product, partial [Menidia menidia]
MELYPLPPSQTRPGAIQPVGRVRPSTSPATPEGHSPNPFQHGPSPFNSQTSADLCWRTVTRAYPGRASCSPTASRSAAQPHPSVLPALTHARPPSLVVFPSASPWRPLPWQPAITPPAWLWRWNDSQSLRRLFKVSVAPGEACDSAASVLHYAWRPEPGGAGPCVNRYGRISSAELGEVCHGVL